MSSDLLFLAITLVHQIFTFVLFKLKRSWLRYCILTFLDALIVTSFITYYSYRLYQIHHRFPELPPNWSVILLFIAIYLFVIIKVALDNRKYRKELEQPLNQPSHAAADDDQDRTPSPRL
jgi:FlaA1/EpsC-like NDP-sugar epimerase